LFVLNFFRDNKKKLPLLTFSRFKRRLRGRQSGCEKEGEGEGGRAKGGLNWITLVGMGWLELGEGLEVFLNFFSLFGGFPSPLSTLLTSHQRETDRAGRLHQRDRIYTQGRVG
jgi:hypothetical protein